MTILELKNITKRYDDKLVVDNINFSIGKGETFGLLGPNGAGKSTIISMICGLVKPDQGDVIIDGYSIIKNPTLAKKSIGVVPQDIALYESLSAIDNLKFWGTLYGLSGSLLKSRIDEVLEITGLKDRAKDKIKNYSGGMKRRINIAAAFMHHPKLLIMDEPTVGIDPQSRNHILEFTKNLNEKYGTTVIYTSHYMEEVESLCNRLMILDEGKIIAGGTQDEIKRMISNEENIEINLTNYSNEIQLKLRALKNVSGINFKDGLLTIIINSSNKNGIQDIIDILIHNNVKIQNLNVKVPNLETVFLKLTGKNLRD
ncbi:ABC-2 type transport system ATP-binding protein [Clostridium acidisoli DSM 12555]|uniref:ABC-2 type transport system ATP-binding protein n=1 Tax=Clostridium acidisoli DSM 12555 TaxID=1121291 RepID=A0A1W1XY46_9CLOT|nr:ABC transporter ATP-binding protein [Clostridium acidisoli]SMC28846.1 ABC-2 type transport system ATP-binding protein [Clostridium acidisoli DSM 12555]